MTQSQNSKQFFRTLNLIHLAMLTGQLLFITVALHLKFSANAINTQELSFPFSLVVPLLTGICIVISKVLYTLLTKQTQTLSDIKDKMKLYMTSCIIQLALLEGAALFSVVVFMMTGEIYFLLFNLVLILFFWVAKPGREKAIIHLKLNNEEMLLIRDDEAVIYEVKTRY
ncbi:hypothetical protein [Carboxylicivirga marina]|uniref:MFS transporter n=1 Tax=Carboxylicivirga marina TaxID=2800988 RepID=A0ABS1HQJ6_9BACT|nr:hypothetical protein [Carboxylicivirga marina]MBK3519890.1 hypothetical protein [Carboxylicivirga marina]